MTDYEQGWYDCRTYAGEDVNGSPEYRAGFAACLKACCWVNVPDLPPNEV